MPPAIRLKLSAGKERQKIVFPCNARPRGPRHRERDKEGGIEPDRPKRDERRVRPPIHPRFLRTGKPDQITSKIHKNLEFPVSKVIPQRLVAAVCFNLSGKLRDERANNIRPRMDLQNHLDPDIARKVEEP